MKSRRWLGWLLSLCCPVAAQAQIELPLLFSDGAVLQRGQPMRVWGKADAGQPVLVRFDGHQASATADAQGHWQVQLPTHAAGGPYDMQISAGDQTRVLHDLLVGDVWLASGQSNMEFELYKARDAQKEIAAAHDLRLRHFKIPKSWAGQAQWQLSGGQWQSATPQDAAQFSAVAYFFARELRQTTGVPIGIIDSTWGGSSIEAWTDAPTQDLDAQAIARQSAQLQARDAAALAQTRQRLARWPQGPIDTSHWQLADFDDQDWDHIPVPGLWESSGYTGMDGQAWYRTSFTLSAAEAKGGILLGVGRIDDSDTTWVNGVQVGETDLQYDLPRQYTVPAQVLHAGLNQVAVKVTDLGAGGGIHGAASEVFVQPAHAARRGLDGQWKFRPGQVSVAMLEGKNETPTLLYNAMIHPLQPYPLRGVIWYQGEANADSVEEAARYRAQFPALIQQWRRQWNLPQLPFLWVQLANFRSGHDRDQTSAWALLRDAQTQALALPATAQAVTIDVGNPGDIHPTDKQDVGHRLALAARHVAYAEHLVYSGPMFERAEFGNGAAQVYFDTQGSALQIRGGGAHVRGFELAAADHQFHSAIATIEGDHVVLASDAVPRPIAVRYAWHDNPEDADLINAQQLPASPFRSDDW